jgi:hypothetical protein
VGSVAVEGAGCVEGVLRWCPAPCHRVIRRLEEQQAGLGLVLRRGSDVARRCDVGQEPLHIRCAQLGRTAPATQQGFAARSIGISMPGPKAVMFRSGPPAHWRHRARRLLRHSRRGFKHGSTITKGAYHAVFSTHPDIVGAGFIRQAVALLPPTRAEISAG